MNKPIPAYLAQMFKNLRQMVQNSKESINTYVDEKNKAIKQKGDDLENATCEQSMVVEDRLTDIEVAICELSEQIITE